MFKKINTLFICLFISSILYAQNGTTKKTRILFVFDASASMVATYENSDRMKAAKKIVSKMIDSLRVYKNLEIALRVYGHQKNVSQKDCKDTKLEVPFTPNNHDKIIQKIYSLQPRGYTPIAYSLSQSASDFPVEQGVRNIIILVTDGLEECQGDPCKVSQELQSKGVFLRPFIVGVGTDPLKFADFFNCVGKYYDGNTEKELETVLGVVISQALNATTSQINLLDAEGLPTETNVNMTLYNATTNTIQLQYMHTMNGRGVPDTLYLDPVLKYDLVIHTIPPIEVKGIETTPGRHNTIAVNAAQGDLELKIPGILNYKDLKCIVRINGKMETISIQEFNKGKKRYLVGTYDLEILTTPRIYLNNVKISANKTTTIEAPQPGVLFFIQKNNYSFAIYQIVNNKQVWVCDIDPSKEKQEIIMQPGKYILQGRSRPETRTIYTVKREFIIASGNNTEIRY